MPVFDTVNFGALHYDRRDIVTFPRGLPGFENCREFVALSLPGTEPLIFIQGLDPGGPCFITAPILVVDPVYRLRLAPEDSELIGLDPAAPPVIGKQVLCLAVLSLREEGPSANLLAPLVVNSADRRAVQAVAQESGYSHRQPLPAGTGACEPAVCVVRGDPTC